MPFTAFLKQQDSNLYSQFALEKFGERKDKNDDVDVRSKATEKFSTPKPFVSDEIPKSWIPVVDLPEKHPALKYLNSRKIPHLERLYFDYNFQEMANKIIPNKFKNPFKEARIIIPMIDKSGKLFKFQGRSLDPKAKIRYLTVDIRSGNENFFWEKYINRLKTVYVLEAPLDAIFVDNGISVAGSGLDAVKNKFRDVVLIFDNEPRSKVILDKMEKAINDGFKILVWDKRVYKKDVNEMVLADENFDINSYIKQRTFSGMRAKLELTKYRRC